MDIGSIALAGWQPITLAAISALLLAFGIAINVWPYSIGTPRMFLLVVLPLSAAIFAISCINYASDAKQKLQFAQTLGTLGEKAKKIGASLDADDKQLGQLSVNVAEIIQVLELEKASVKSATAKIESVSRAVNKNNAAVDTLNNSVEYMKALQKCRDKRTETLQNWARRQQLSPGRQCPCHGLRVAAIFRCNFRYLPTNNNPH